MQREEVTMIERYDPFGRMMSLRQMMDRLMEDAFIVPRGEGQAAPAGSLAMNVYEEGDNFVVEAQIPGMKPEDIDINIEHGTLTVRGESKSEQERRERNYVIREHRAGSFSRSIRLPDMVDPDACEATYDNGILRLTLPKSEQAKPRRIPIQAGRQGSERAIPAGGSEGARTDMTAGANQGRPTTEPPEPAAAG
jgi:HSP20 family protein